MKTNYLKKIPPTLWIIASFLILIILGAVSLYLKSSTYKSISFIDALFTSTSAVCVTGLAVVDTPTTFNHQGRLILMLLMQIGGLGVLTITSFIMILLTKNRHYLNFKVIDETLTQGLKFEFRKFILRLFKFVFVIEFCGALFLFFYFYQKYDLLNAVELSIFHSISAFCKAGFSLFSNSLENYYNNWYLLGVISILIISGGLGFFVLEEIYEKIKKTKYKFSFHSKVVISATIFLIFFGALLIFIFEYGCAFIDYDFSTKILSSIFQSITSRTAGFNSVNLNSFNESTLLIIIVLMFIGGSPGSCAGGIKTTTFTVIFFSIYSKIIGKNNSQLFKRTFSKDTLNKSVILIISALILLFICVFMLLSILENHHYIKELNNYFFKILFEAVSAFGTVGLSLGITSFLSTGAKIIVILLMFLGRIGLLTFALIILDANEKIEYSYPEEDLMIG